ncbi:MAG: 50S ribosomal protein L11 methyltransferase [Ferrovum sp.]|nr:50S ribosomal protein L11 methyltransferase [Ferrovum sp.]NDU88168.1 50S ribosomal protein L11 methyltransferase [Ferrovum sp.]
MSWTRLLIKADEIQAESLSEDLMEHGALSVTVTPWLEDGVAEVPLFGEPGCPDSPLWPQCQVEVLLPQEVDADDWFATVCRLLPLDPPPVYHSDNVADEDWVRLTQSQFDPIPAAPGLWIVPTWHSIPDDSAINVRLDPGQAFGTGSHPTTQLCLQWLMAHPPQGQRILDYGCGSGILAIVAAMLSADQPIGVDIDPVAVQTARENAQLNQVSVSFFEATQTLDTPVFDGVIANILTNPLMVLAPLLLSHVRPGGWLTLSGILTPQAQQVIAAYAPHCPLTIVDEQEGWVCLSGTKQVY